MKIFAIKNCVSMDMYDKSGNGSPLPKPPERRGEGPASHIEGISLDDEKQNKKDHRTPHKTKFYGLF